MVREPSKPQTLSEPPSMMSVPQEDMVEYVNPLVHSIRSVQCWREEDRKLDVYTFFQKADNM
jgi:hypothetical protein